MLDIDTAKVARVVEPGAEFQFTFDLGDNWTHRCLVGEEKVDPLEGLGVRPDARCPTGRSAIAAADAARFLAAVTGRDIDDALQQVGVGIPLALEQRREQAEPVALSVINRLTWRAGVGDEVLAEDLLARLRGEPLKGRVVLVDLEMLGTVMGRGPEPVEQRG